MNTTMPEDNPQFEIQFFESVLKRVPDYVDVIEILGCLYTDVGQIDDGLRMDQMIVKIKPNDSTAHYNLACSLALKGQTTKSLASLEKSIELGYNDLEWLLQDDDIISLRSHEKFKKIINQLKSNLEKTQC